MKMYKFRLRFLQSLFLSSDQQYTSIGLDNREVLLHIKCECVHVKSDSGAQIHYTSRLRTLSGFASHRDVSADKQVHWYQQMTGQ